MGTSSSYSSPTTPKWSRAKSATSRFASGGGGSGGRNVAVPIARFVEALGGAGAATRGATVGRAVAGRFINFAQIASERGFDAALRDIGLQDAIGLPTDEVLQRIVDSLAADSNTLDETAAREALVDIIRELLKGADDLEAALTGLNEAAILDLLCRFISAYIFRRYMKALGDRLRAHAESADDARRRQNEIKRFISASVTIAFEQFDITSADWRSHSEQMLDRLMREVFDTLAMHDD
jgi:hypothetical protein